MQKRVSTCNQEDWRACETFGFITLCSATYHLKVGPPVLLKPATKVSLGDRKALKIYILDQHGLDKY